MLVRVHLVVYELILLNFLDLFKNPICPISSIELYHVSTTMVLSNNTSLI